MGIYKTLCYKVEDLMVKLITKKEDPLIVKEKVTKYRFEKEQLSHQRKMERNKKLEEQRQLKQQQREQQERKRIEKEELERKEIESLVSKLMRNTSQSYNSYEFNEIKRNKHFFQSLYERVLEPNEKLETFIFCEYDKSSKKEIKGYLLPTNKRVLFLTKNLNFMDKFRYQTIINVNWFKDGLLERGLRIQYGKRKLEFDEMYDHEQLMKVGNIILNNSKTGTK
ncbi:PH (Pleckstrin Homology) domain-containing protein [Bacillus oleivorans]|uniref:PH (Pleckstrin Homology) domain-containing protein n=1 Tax=Bacillus oleivorans TaxID=1448271 RepID=A0A285CPR7_9BACI|nr:PH domain-containing protein [Bacillus oleivorans]SNX69514.1 PH (Pleckstrin Homology) domain-containing protein [Bacillus oleivorans]